MADKESTLSLRLRATNEASPAFEAAARALESFKNIFTDMTPVMDTFSRSMESISSAGGTLSNSLGEDAASTRELIDTMRSLNESMRASTGDSRSLDEALMSVETAISSVTMAVRAQTKALGTLSTRTKEVKESQLGALIAVQMLGDSMERVGKLGEHIFDYAIEQGAEFQQSMKNVQTVLAANITGNESWNDKMRDSAGLTQDLQDLALNLGSRGAQSANEVAAAMDTMLRAGVDGKTILQGAAEAAQNVAIVTGDKLDESANLVTEIYHQFRESFAQNGKSMQENMKQTGDVLTGTLLSARISSNDFVNSLKYVGPVASELGSSFTDAATATALLSQYGIKGSQAGTSLKRALTNLLEPTKAGSVAMKELGLIQNGQNMLIDQSTGKMKNLTDIQEILHKSLDGLTEAKKAQYIHDMFGQYALAGSLVLANENSQAYQRLKEKIEGVSAENAAASMLDTFQGHMRQLQAAVSTTAKEFGMSFLPALNALLPIGNGILGWMRELTPANKEFLMGVLGIGSALVVAGGALAAFAVTARFAGEGMKAIKSLFMIEAEGKAAISIFKAFALSVREVGLAEAFMTAMSPLGWVVLIGTAVAGAAMLIMQHWGQIKPFLENTWSAITSAVHTAWNAITAFFQKWGLDILAALLGPIGILGLEIYRHWDEIKSFTSTKFNELTAGVQNIWSGFKAWISNAVQQTAQAVVDSFQWLYNHNYYFHDLVDFAVKSFTFLRDKATEIFNAVKSFLSTTWSAISQEASSVWNATSSALSTIFQAISTAANTIFSPIATFLSSLWGGVSTTSQTMWSGIRSTLGGLFRSTVNDAESIFNTLGTYFTQLWTEAEQWGANVVHMIAQGIRNAAHEVAQAASSVAHSIASFLGFHSPTKDGPGADADQWAPNFTRMFANGLLAGTPDVAIAASNLIKPLSSLGIVPEVAIGAKGNVSTSGANSGMVSVGRGGFGGSARTQNNTFNITVNGSGKDGRQIGTDIAEAIRQQLSFAI